MLISEELLLTVKKISLKLRIKNKYISKNFDQTLRIFILHTGTRQQLLIGQKLNYSSPRSC